MRGVNPLTESLTTAQNCTAAWWPIRRPPCSTQTRRVPRYSGRLRLKCDGTRTETRFRLSAKRTSPFKSAGAPIQSTTCSRGVRLSGNARYTMFRGSVKGTGYPLHSPVSPSLPLPCVTVCHQVSTGLYRRTPCSCIANDFVRSPVLTSTLKETNFVLRRNKGEGLPVFNPLNPELNPIYLLALLGAHHFLHVSRIRVKLLTFRRLTSYIHGAPILDVSRSHTTTQHSR